MVGAGPGQILQAVEAGLDAGIHPRLPEEHGSGIRNSDSIADSDSMGRTAPPSAQLWGRLAV